MLPTISLAMIVRNEEANLEECLQSVMHQVDELVIVDTGSTDQTVRIARTFTTNLYFYEWQGDFSKARNFALSKCTKEWILSLDGDEKLDVSQGSIQQLIQDHGEAEAFFLPLLTNISREPERFSVLRLFRNTRDYIFQGKIHEQIRINKKNIVGFGQGPVIWHKDITFTERNKKRQRNLGLLTAALRNEADNCYLQYYMGVEWLGMGRYEKALPYFQAAVAQIAVEQIMFRGPAVRYLIDCLQFLGRRDEALVVCEEECRSNPTYTDVFFAAGAILEEQGQYTKAICYFQKSIQLGEPPVWFYHSQGTESFLAEYHLAFCYEKIGRPKLAEQHYWQALTVNPRYSCPLYGLFLLKINDLPVEGVFQYFKDHHSFSKEQWGEILAGLFLAAGVPRLAVTCYEQSMTLQAGDNSTRIKSLLYGGRIAEGLKILADLSNQEKTNDLTLGEIAGYLILGEYHTGKKLALALWAKEPAQRSQVWAMLGLIGELSGKPWYTKPEKSREKVVIQTQLELLAQCLRSSMLEVDDPYGGGYKTVALAIIRYLERLSVESYGELMAFMQRQGQGIRSRLVSKYPIARGLVR